MSTTQWFITMVITLLAGGMMGSVIGIIATNRRNRIQPIAVQKEVMPFINRQIEGSASKAEIVLNVDGEKSSFSNLTLARITLQNTGNQDYQEFKFGVTVTGFNLAVSIQTETQDRYHEMAHEPPISLNHQDDEIDFTLKPFNRNDIYSIVLFINPIDAEDLDIELATKHPVKFVEWTAYREVATSIFFELLEQTPVIGLPARAIRSIWEKRLL